MVEAIPERGKIINIKTIERLKQALVDEGLISKDGLRAAEGTARQENENLGKTLVTLGFLTEDKLAKFIGEKLQVPYVNIKDYSIDRKVLELIPEKIARRYNILPLFEIENVLTVAMSNPLDLISIDDVTAVVDRY